MAKTNKSIFTYEIEKDMAHGDWLIGHYWWIVRNGDGDKLKGGWARSHKAALKKIHKVALVDPITPIEKGTL